MASIVTPPLQPEKRVRRTFKPLPPPVDRSYELAKPVLAIIRAYGWDAEFFSRFDLGAHKVGDPRDPNTLRVQVREDVAPPQKVKAYEAAMKAGAGFPPCVVTADFVTVDGSTRIAAAIEAQMFIVPMLVLNVSYRGASEQTLHLLNTLGGQLNEGPNRLNRKDKYNVIKSAMKSGWSDDRIKQAFTPSNNEITNARREYEAEKVIAGLYGVGQDSKIKAEDFPATTLREIGTKTFRNLHEGPKLALLELVKDARLLNTDIPVFARAMHDTGNDEAAIKFVQNKRQGELSPRIKDVQNGKLRISTPKQRRLRALTGEIIKLGDGDTTTLIETDPNESPEHLDYIKRALDTLEGLRQQQELAMVRRS